MAFTVLTAAQGATLRNRIGDTDTAAPELADSALDALFTASGEDLDLTTVAALQEMVGRFAMHVDIGGTSQLNEQRHQRYRALLELLAYWEGKTGTIGGGLRLGTIDLGLDTE